MKRYDFYSMEDFENSGISAYDTPVCVHENGWFKADLLTDTKSVKVALNRFFRAFPEVASWRESMEGCFKMHDKDGGFHWEIDTTNADDGTIYIFLNLNEKARGGLD